MEPRPRIEGSRFAVSPPGAGSHRRFEDPAAATEPNSTGPDADPGSLIDFVQIAHYLRFVAGAVRRHWLLGPAVFLLTVIATGALVAILPKTYHVQAKLLAQRNAVMASLSNPGRTIPWDADAPTRAAAETVLRHDNLVSLIKQTDLIERWARTRAPILRVKDALTATIFGDPRTDEEKLEAMVLLLEARLTVTTGSAIEGTVTIDIDWPDPQSAYELVEAAQQTFREARQIAETSAITEAITILQGYSTTLHEELSRTVAEQQRVQAKRPSAGRASRSPSTVGVSSTPPSPPSVASLLKEATASAALESDAEIVRLKAELAKTRQEIKDLEEQRQRQVTDLQTRLAQLRLVYTENHPTVLEVQQSLASLVGEPPQLLGLRAEEQSLAAEYARRLASASPPSDGLPLDLTWLTQTARPSPSPPVTSEPRDAPPNDASAEYDTLRFRLELNQLQSVLDRIDGARIELAVSEAAFKYRYTVIRPAQVPTKPVKPDRRRILIAGLLGAFGLALMTVLAADLLSDRIFATWQVERQLGLPALGVMRNS